MGTHDAEFTKDNTMTEPEAIVDGGHLFSIFFLSDGRTNAS